jgi:Na+-transporting methylmalonyl-CoA/oxaloacetate decarboxylase gamma subunit
MSISETILVALFVMAVVIAVLCMLWVIIKIFSFIIREIEKNKY